MRTMRQNFPHFSSAHVDDEPLKCTCYFQILANLCRMVLACLRRRCYIAFPVDNNLRLALLALGDRVNDAGYHGDIFVSSIPALEHR